MKSDTDIRRDTEAQTQAELPYSHSLIRILVTDGRVRLEGQVAWSYQRERAERAARRVQGAKAVSNRIRVKPRVRAAEVEQSLEDAFRRSAQRDAKGTVRSWAERDEGASP